MGFYNKYPYTDFHEMNLDWFLKEFKNVENLVKKINSDISLIGDEVNETLTEWLNDGTISDIIKEYFTAVPTKNMIIDKKGRFLSDSVTAPASAPIYVQGADVFRGQYYIAGNAPDDNVYITRFNSSGVETGSTHSNAYGHVNDITILDDIIYLADTLNNRIHTANATSLSYGGNVDVSSIFDTVTGIGNVNGTLYAAGVNGGNIVIASAQPSILDFTELYSMPRPANSVIQGICCYQDSLYMLFNQSNQVYRLNLNTGEILEAFMIPDGDGLYPTGECESLFVDDDIIYMMGTIYYPNLYGFISTDLTQNQHLAYMFQTNLAGVMEGSDPRSYMDPQTNFNINLNENAAWVFNPGMTVNSALEASALANYHKNSAILCSNLTHGILALTGCDCKIIGASDQLDALQAINCSLLIDNMTVNYLYAQRCTIYCDIITNMLKVNLIDCDVDMTKIDLTNCAVFSLTHSSVDINEITGYNPALTGSFGQSGVGNVIKVLTYPLTGVHKLVEAANPEHVLLKAFPRGDCLSIFFPANLINIDFGNQIFSSSRYTNMGINSGDIYVTDTSSVTTPLKDLTTPPLVEITGLHR